MKITLKTRNEEQLEERDYRDCIKILIDGEEVFCVYDGEREDNSLSRNFANCYSIPCLLEKAYQAGIAGEELIVEKQSI
jgi:hypothetical protein